MQLQISAVYGFGTLFNSFVFRFSVVDIVIAQPVQPQLKPQLNPCQRPQTQNRAQSWPYGSQFHRAYNFYSGFHLLLLYRKCNCK